MLLTRTWFLFSFLQTETVSNRYYLDAIIVSNQEIDILYRYINRYIYRYMSYIIPTPLELYLGPTRFGHPQSY